MIIKEKYKENLTLTYSDAGFKIRQVSTGIVYDEAVDVVDKEYVETDEKRDDRPADAGEAAELLSIITGEGGV